VTHARDARAAKLLTLRFGDGSVDASVDDGTVAAPRPVERRPRQSYMGSQPGLFDRPEE
jgi:exodeoxyribonuclease VII large subunit